MYRLHSLTNDKLARGVVYRYLPRTPFLEVILPGGAGVWAPNLSFWRNLCCPRAAHGQYPHPEARFCSLSERYISSAHVTTGRPFLLTWFKSHPLSTRPADPQSAPDPASRRVWYLGWRSGNDGFQPLFKECQQGVTELKLNLLRHPLILQGVLCLGLTNPWSR